jgi:hypothetical protein
MALDDIETVSVHRSDAALAIHEDVVRIYELAYNAHTFDFEKDLGRFAAPDITVIFGSQRGGRWLLSETSAARAEYVRSSDAKVTIDVQITCAADLDTTVVLVTEGNLTFTYPDLSTCKLPLLASSTLRLVNGAWIFQHVHFSKGCW